jgi:hypothetical protein
MNLSLISKKFFDWTLYISDHIRVITDTEQKTIVAINKEEEEEIHVILTINDTGEVILKPNWNVMFRISAETKSIYIEEKNS